MTTTSQSSSTQDTPTKGSALPLTGEDNACYLCDDHEATHVGYAALGPVSGYVGLCKHCWTLEYSDYETTIDLTGTRNHRKLVADDGSYGYTYETDEGTYRLAKYGNHWSRSGPDQDSHFEETIIAGGGTAEAIPGHELPAIPGDAVPIPEHTDVRVACPDCGTLRTVTYGVLRDHNERAHDGEQIAKPVDQFTVDDLPNMNRVRNPDTWTTEFGGSIADDGELIRTRLHDNESEDTT